MTAQSLHRIYAYQLLACAPKSNVTGRGAIGADGLEMAMHPSQRRDTAREVDVKRSRRSAVMEGWGGGKDCTIARNRFRSGL